MLWHSVELEDRPHSSRSDLPDRHSSVSADTEQKISNSTHELSHSIQDQSVTKNETIRSCLFHLSVAREYFVTLYIIHTSTFFPQLDTFSCPCEILVAFSEESQLLLGRTSTPMADETSRMCQCKECAETNIKFDI